MNVAFHELVGVAIASEAGAYLAARGERGRRTTWAAAGLLAIGSHALLDNAPHYYPLAPWLDATLSIALVAAAVWRAPGWMRGWLFAICVASLLPDIIDHVPEDLRKHLGLDIPVPPNFFPWHWPSNRASLPGRTGPYWIESLTNHAIVVAFATASLARTRGLWAARRLKTPPA